MKTWPLVSCFAGSVIAVAACGARSSLPDDLGSTESGGGRDAGSDVSHPELDASPDVFDAQPDAFDAGPDVVDAQPDGMPPQSCVDVGVTYIYLIGQADKTLYRFYPPTMAVDPIGAIDCVGARGTPFSMAVDRNGIAYVVFTSGDLYRVSTATASCRPTGFVAGQQGFSPTFGMGFSANATGVGETLFVAGSLTGTNLGPLATIDLATLKLSMVGPFSKEIGDAELTGTGGARLYAFGILSSAGYSAIHLSQIEKRTARVIDDTFLSLSSGPTRVTGWAFAFWGGDFYFFTSTVTTGPTTISRYHPGDAPRALPLATIPATIVGAGVSTCAPQQ